LLKYQKEIDQVFEYLYESWMDDNDRKQIKQEIYERLQLNDEILNKQLDTGVKNGHPIEEQMKLIKQVMKAQTEGD
jgi:hypothetical protein